MANESNFDPLAVSPKNAQGLMQLNPRHGGATSRSAITDPVQNIRGGMAYLRALLRLLRGRPHTHAGRLQRRREGRQALPRRTALRRDAAVRAAPAELHRPPRCRRSLKPVGTVWCMTLHPRNQEETMNPNEADLLVEIRDGVSVLTMNRPERLNALSQAMIDTAIATLERCASDASIGCVVLAGRRARLLCRRRRDRDGRRAEQWLDARAADRPSACDPFARRPVARNAEGQHRGDQQACCRCRHGAGPRLRLPYGCRQRQADHCLCQGRVPAATSASHGHWCALSARPRPRNCSSCRRC